MSKNIEIVGPTLGLTNCPQCIDEVNELEQIILSNKHIIGLFAKYSYIEERKIEGWFFTKRQVTYVTLECGGKIKFREKDGMLHDFEVLCDE